MARNFYTGTEEDLANGSANAVKVITPDRERFGVSADFLADYTSLTERFNEQFRLARSPATRTPVVIADKNTLKWQLKQASVLLAAMVCAQPTLEPAEVVSLWMNQRTTRQRRHLPQNPPRIEVVSVVGRVVKINLRDPDSTSRGMPFGAFQAQIFSYVGETAPENSRQYHYEGPSSRAKATLVFPNDVPSGATIWLSANWVSKRGEVGIGSPPICFTLQGGAIAPAA
jgi:hypothetical protein